MKYLLLLALSVFGLHAQSFTNTPPVSATNMVRLTAATRLVWDANPEPDIAGYFVTATIPATNRLFTTNTFIPVSLLTPPKYSGPFRATVTALNSSGLESDPSVPINANVGTPPQVVVNLTIQIVLE